MLGQPPRFVSSRDARNYFVASTVAYAIVSFAGGAVSVTCSPHCEKTVDPPPVLLVIVSLSGSVVLPEEIVVPGQAEDAA